MPRPIVRLPGETPSERYLAQLADRTFIKLWSYPNLYKKPNKELVDLFVVSGRNIILFSDKDITYQRHSRDPEVGWQRWFRSAVEKSVYQLESAERWIRDFPARVFLDRQATKPFPWPIGDPAEYTFHRVAVARGIREACVEHFGCSGTGGLMIRTDLDLSGCLATPFHVGNACNRFGLVHVLDEYSMDLVLGELDTITDFVWYLAKRQRLFTNTPHVTASGEEQLLQVYLTSMSAANEHDFVFPINRSEGTPDTIWLADEGFSMASHPQYRAKQIQDHPSYLWDQILDHIAQNVLDGTLLESDDIEVRYHQESLQQLAREPRLSRRVLSKSLLDMDDRTRRGTELVRYQQSPCFDDTVYLFYFGPFLGHERGEISRVLWTRCAMAAWRLRDQCTQVMGLAVNSDSPTKSYNLAWVRASDLTDEIGDFTEEMSAKHGILPAGMTLELRHTESEYPNVPARPRRLKRGYHPSQIVRTQHKVGRNEACPCGSGKKFKKCCGP